MTHFKANIIIFDSHEFRGSAIRTIIENSQIGCHHNLHNLDFESTPAVSSVPAEIETGIVPARSCLGILMIGGQSLSHHEAISRLSEIRTHFPDIALVALCDKCSREDIEIAVRMDLQGIIPSHLPEGIAIAALKFILAGGHYFPHPGAEEKPSATPPSYKVIASGVQRIGQDAVSSSGLMRSASDEDESVADADSLVLTSRQREVLEALRAGHRTR